MSFITKRERVFNEYDLFNLPARNEGKLKAYASCTDARAWSHFCSDKTEHLVEIIKRNNESCKPKYVPTSVIVDTLMLAKNNEISRLKHKIEEFEQMLAAYDQLDLSCEQKCEIANAHAAIKAANKELDDMCLDLDLSGFTEGIDSEAFETGKSRGDEPDKNRGDESDSFKGVQIAKSTAYEPFEKESTLKMEAKSNQFNLSCPCDASTSAHDPRIDEMQETIISKDAKLNAMQNTIAVMENDVCEPYCIYAHIYTALEKIFGILCQNTKYKQYLDLLTAGKDIRCLDIKAKILFKLKVLEKFCLALIAPCSQDFNPSSQECSCYRAEIIAHVETTFALTSAESKQPNLDNKRAQLVADIMQHAEMKEILSKESTSVKADDELDDGFGANTYCIDVENLNRLKNLQDNYDDLMTCYENLKHDRDCLQMKCQKYEELEKEMESLRNQLREYNQLWNEKEHYRNRSKDLDTLKEQYFLISNETSNLETQLKTESEINHIKSNTIDELREENMSLEKRLNDVSIASQKEKNALECKLKETECTVMCQEQQIKSLSVQINKLLEQDHPKVSQNIMSCNQDLQIINKLRFSKLQLLHPQSNEDTRQSIVLIDEIESLREQIKNLKEALFYNDEEKQQLQENFQDKLQLINELKMEIEDWKSSYDKSLQRNNYLEKYIEDTREEISGIMEENKTLSQELAEKATAVENLLNIVSAKSQEIGKLTNEIIDKRNENDKLINEIQEIRQAYDGTVISLESEKKQALISLQSARQESQELLEKIKDYDEVIHKQNNLSKSVMSREKDCRELKDRLVNTIKENNTLREDLASSESSNLILLQEMEKLRDVNKCAIDNINGLKDETYQYQRSLQIAKKESEILESKLVEFKKISQQLQNLREDKNRLENELHEHNQKVENAISSIRLTKQESTELMNKIEDSELLKEDMKILRNDYQRVQNENHVLQNDLTNKKSQLKKLLHELNNLQIENEKMRKEIEIFKILQKEMDVLKKKYDEVATEKIVLQNDFDNKTEEFNNLYNRLENKIEENRELSVLITDLRKHQTVATNSITALENQNSDTKIALNAAKKESALLSDKLKCYELLDIEFEKLRQDHNRIDLEKKRLQQELDRQLLKISTLEKDNHELNKQYQHLLSHNEYLENTIMNTRNELSTNSNFTKDSFINISKELENINMEKAQNLKKIRDLLDKVEELENTIFNLSEDISARDDKIAVLENHINELQNEIRRLHEVLADAVNSGEQISVHSYEKINQSLKNLDAHHSRATHNMKMEIAKLQEKNSRLEEKVSINKIKSEESSRDKHKYMSQIIHLQNEREIIITDIKQLELKNLGDSALSPDNCDTEHILASLDRIRKYLETKQSKSSSLEQTLSKVQNSSQLLLSKADEAKKIVEKEKQKILSEKEDAINEKLNMEKQLVTLKENLESQIAQDKSIIKDLEAEILNQKLIIDKINKSTKNYISKLEEEMQSLQSLYQKSTTKVSQLQGKVQNLSNENNMQLETIEKINLNLEQKCNEILTLQNNLAQLKNITRESIALQTFSDINYNNVSTQTDKYQLHSTEPDLNIHGFKEEKSPSENLVKINRTSQNRPHLSELLPREELHSVNEVQILTANVNPSFNFVKSTYLNYKLNRLSPGRLEQYCISCTGNIVHTSKEESSFSNTFSNQYPDAISQETGETHLELMTQNSHLIDIYNIQSMHTNSSKEINYDITQYSNKHTPKNPTKSSIYTELSSENENIETSKNAFAGSRIAKSKDKDVFVIYRDSVNNSTYVDTSDDKIQWSINGHKLSGEIIIYDPIEEREHEFSKEKKANIKYKTEDDLPVYQEEEENEAENNEDDSVKLRLKVNVPRVGTDSLSIITTSDGDKKSIDSYTLYPSQKQVSQSDTRISNDIQNIKQETPSLPSINVEKNKKESRNSLDISSDEETIRRVLKKEMNSMENKNYNNKHLSQNHTNQQKLPKQNNSDIKCKKSFDTETNKVNLADSYHKLSRIGADVLLLQSISDKDSTKPNSFQISHNSKNFGLEYILHSLQREVDPNNDHTYIPINATRRTRSEERFDQKTIHENSSSKRSPLKVSSLEYRTISSVSPCKLSDESQTKSLVERSIMAKLDASENYENKIQLLTKTLENVEKDYKKKMEAIKQQYDSNIKSIINEHNQGVKSIQGLHEDTLQDIIKIHENEIENLRSMSIEAMRKADKLERENKTLKSKIQMYSSTGLDEEPTKISIVEVKKRKSKSRADTKTLTKTNVEAFNVKPKLRSHGPCTCSIDINISDTIRNIFEQVDVDQRKMAEYAYLKYIANKILNDNIETLDAQELSFLHLKVCRTWKLKLNKEEALQKRIDSLETELLNKQRHAQQHIAELDRKVAEERRRLQEVREAVCRSTPAASRAASPDEEESQMPLPPPPIAAEKDFSCNTGECNHAVSERRSAGDLAPSTTAMRTKRNKTESNRAVLAKLDVEERREKKLYNDEPPTRLRRTHDRSTLRSHKK